MNRAYVFKRAAPEKVGTGVSEAIPGPALLCSALWAWQFTAQAGMGQ